MHFAHQPLLCFSVSRLDVRLYMYLVRGAAVLYFGIFPLLSLSAINRPSGSRILTTLILSPASRSILNAGMKARTVSGPAAPLEFPDKDWGPYFSRLEAKIEAGASQPLRPSVAALRTAVEKNAEVRELAGRMVREVPPHAGSDALRGPRLRDCAHMYELIDAALGEPPPFNMTTLVAFPLCAVFDWVMDTPSGRAFFLLPSVNDALRSVLADWARLLDGPQSLAAFAAPGGWMCAEARAKLNMHRFQMPDACAVAWGFPSWNKWFIRRFRPGLRPIAAPSCDGAVVHPCEASKHALCGDLALRTKFWVKGAQYSLVDMLAGEARASPFIGGDVYQGYLSTFEYHRWHAPLSGVVREIVRIPGAMFAEAPYVPPEDNADKVLSQTFHAHIASRAVVVIDAKHTAIGAMCFVAIGMAEAASIVISVKVGEKVTKGQEFGYFQFGGSSYCVVFRKRAIGRWLPDAVPGSTQVYEVNSLLAEANENL